MNTRNPLDVRCLGGDLVMVVEILLALISPRTLKSCHLLLPLQASTTQSTLEASECFRQVHTFWHFD